MATEVITRTLCDVHLSADESVDGALYTVTIDGETWEIDVCPDDRETINRFREWVGKYGRPAVKARKPGRPPTVVPANGDGYPCPARDCDYLGLTQSRLTAHARQKHSATVADLRGEVTDFRCPVCGSYFDGNQGLSMHVSRTHGGWPDDDAPTASADPAPVSTPEPAKRKARKSASPVAG